MTGWRLRARLVTRGSLRAAHLLGTSRMVMMMVRMGVSMVAAVLAHLGPHRRLVVDGVHLLRVCRCCLWHQCCWRWSCLVVVVMVVVMELLLFELSGRRRHWRWCITETGRSLRRLQRQMRLLTNRFKVVLLLVVMRMMRLRLPVLCFGVGVCLELIDTRELISNRMFWSDLLEQSFLFNRAIVFSFLPKSSLV